MADVIAEGPAAMVGTKNKVWVSGLPLNVDSMQLKEGKSIKV